MKQDGFTLIELLVVVTIITIVTVVFGFEFTGWIARYKVENQIKTMHADLMNARQKAMERNTQYVAQLLPGNKSYVICEDSNGNNACDAPAETTTSVSQMLSKNNLRYPLTWALDLGAPPNPPANTIIIDRRGILPCDDPIVTCTGTIWLTNPDTGAVYGPNDVDYDCIVLSTVKINVGKYDATIPGCTVK
jgi:prepilin-type N-terminal cleavage/methylation domain-containing protein